MRVRTECVLHQAQSLDAHAAFPTPAEVGSYRSPIIGTQLVIDVGIHSSGDAPV